jgi:hypothetical protein
MEGRRILMQITRGKLETAQKVVVYGPEGIGKSTFASLFPDPTFIDTEGSTKKLDVARTPKPNSWTMLLEQVKYFRDNPSQCKTLVIDTADWAERLCVEHICSKSQKSGIEDFGYGKGYTYLEEEFGRLLNLLEEVIERRVNVVITAHASMRKFEQPDELGAYDRWELKLEKKTAPLLKEWADMVLFANYKTYVVNVDGQGAQKGKNKAQGGKRVMYTTHHSCWDAKNRHDLPDEVPFEYQSIAHCIPSGVSQSQKQSESPRQTAAPEQPKTDAALKPVNNQPAAASSEPDPLQGKINPPEPQELPGIPKALAELMTSNEVLPEEIQKAVASKGYYPKDTPIENYDPSFVSGVLVGAWSAVFGMIKKNRLESGQFVSANNADEIPFN